MQPQIEPQFTPIQQPSSSSSFSDKILPISSLAVALVSLLIRIFGIIISNQNRQTVGEEYGADSGGAFESKAEQIACTRPETAKDITYLYLNYDEGETGVFVDPAGTIEYFTNGTNASGEETSATKSVKTDTSTIFEQLFNNGINEFSDYKYSEEEDTETEWTWLVRINTSNTSSCEAKGSSTPPAWFTDLKNLVDSKINQ